MWLIALVYKCELKALIRQKYQKISNKVIDCGYFSKHYLQNSLQDLSSKLSIKLMGFDYYICVLVRIFKDDVDIGAHMVIQGMSFSDKNAYQKRRGKR